MTHAPSLAEGAEDGRGAGQAGQGVGDGVAAEARGGAVPADQSSGHGGVVAEGHPVRQTSPRFRSPVIISHTRGRSAADHGLGVQPELFEGPRARGGDHHVRPRHQPGQRSATLGRHGSRGPPTPSRG